MISVLQSHQRLTNTSDCSDMVPQPGHHDRVLEIFQEADRA